MGKKPGINYSGEFFRWRIRFGNLTNAGLLFYNLTLREDKLNEEVAVEDLKIGRQNSGQFLIFFE